ncbi:hypothetical protein ACNF7N_09295 [Campylobacter coli]
MMKHLNQCEQVSKHDKQRDKYISFITIKAEVIEWKSIEFDGDEENLKEKYIMMKVKPFMLLSIVLE